MAQGRWWYVMDSEAEAILNDAYATWARELLGGSFWNNGAVASSELGWQVSGYGRTVLTSAMRRARLWPIPSFDLYLSTHVSAHEWGYTTWASQSLAILSEWGIPDWPVWVPTDHLD